jgi:hypothetical protein
MYVYLSIEIIRYIAYLKDIKYSNVSSKTGSNYGMYVRDPTTGCTYRAVVGSFDSNLQFSSAQNLFYCKTSYLFFQQLMRKSVWMSFHLDKWSLNNEKMSAP